MNKTGSTGLISNVVVIVAAPEFLSEHGRRRWSEGEERYRTDPSPVPQPAAEEHRCNSH